MEWRGGCKIVSVLEVIRGAVGVSGAAWAVNASVKPKIKEEEEDDEEEEASSRWPAGHHRILSSLTEPTLIIGTLDLGKDCRAGCFSLSDGGGGSLCCALLDLEDCHLAIGKKIHVVSWNYIPFRDSHASANGGFLEIITWNLPEGSSSSSYLKPPAPPLPPAPPGVGVVDVVGRLDCVSPISVVPCSNVPCTNQNKSQHQISNNVTGFLAQLSPSSSSTPITVYLFGSSTLLWHSSLSKLVGKLVCITALKNKLVFIGKQDSRLMFITTPKSTFHTHLHPTTPPPPPPITGNGESGSYSGLVTRVYLKAMVVELDRRVCVLLTYPFSPPPHFVRVGAFISLSNVHFICTNFSGTRMLLLGACFRTSINLHSFSPLDSPSLPLPSSHTHSLLANFSHSLVFSARFWLLLTISCFKKKFSTFFPLKQILGSKRKQGLVHMYAISCLPSLFFRPPHGLFNEFCNHAFSGCGHEPNYTHPKLPVPISNFISHCEVLWLSVLRGNQPATANKNVSSCSRGQSYSRLIRRIISSADVGVVLMGILQVSSSSGRLQLVDSSGSIDVVIPDIPSPCHPRHIYEVAHYNIVIEGLPAQVGASQLPTNESFSYRGIFDHVPSVSKIKPSSIYVHFFMRDATCLNLCLHLPYMDWNDNLMEITDGMFHLLLVTHKFPAMKSFQGDSVVSLKSSFFVEAMILPWVLFLPGEHRDAHMTATFRECPDEHLEYPLRKTLLENLCRKRFKIAHEPSKFLIPTLKDKLEESGNESRCHNSCNLCLPHEFPCLVGVRNFDANRQTRPGVLLCSHHGVTGGVVGKPRDKTVLIELKSEVFNIYELLRVGGYYVMEYAREELQEMVKDHRHFSAGKMFVTSQTPLWSLSFSCNDVLSSSELFHDRPLQTNSNRNDTGLSGCSPTGELFFQQLPSQTPETCSHDIHLQFSIDAMNLLKVVMNGLEDELIKPTSLSRVPRNMYTCTGTMMVSSMHPSGIADPDYRLPHGSLVSVCGNIVDVHRFSCCYDIQTHQNCESIDNIHWMRFFHGIPSSICIHLSRDNDIVRLHGSLSKHGNPIGMGPGVIATFHRVLVIGEFELMLTPTSFIVVNSIKEVVQEKGERCPSPEFGLGLLSDLDTVPSILISEFIQCSERKPSRFCCRIVAIYVLVMEKEKPKIGTIHSGKQSNMPILNIPLAGFILDDGSSLCCCWTMDEAAKTLLRLHEEATFNSYDRNSWRLKRCRLNKTRRTAYHHLDRILNKHHRIIVKNQGSMLDSSCQDVMFSVNSRNVLSHSDEKILKLIITSACCSSACTIVGSAMDSNATSLLEKHLSRLDMTAESMKNIWATEVLPVDHLSKTRSLIQELVKQ